MLNLVRLRAEAAYPDGRKATGAEAYAAYGRESGPVFERLGGRIVWQGRFELMLIGPEAERWDHCFIAEYPSVARVRRDDPRSGLSRSREAPPGGGGGFAIDPARGIAHRQDVWGDTEVASFVGWVERSETHHGLNSGACVDGFRCALPILQKNRRPRGAADRFFRRSFRSIRRA